MPLNTIQIKAAARRLCERRGIDPDSRMPWPMKPGETTSAWVVLSAEVSQWEEIRRVVEEIESADQQA